jgi:hypothetical protein
MGKILFLKLSNAMIEIEEGKTYKIFFKNGDPPMIGSIIEDMDFEHKGQIFFYIWNPDEHEDYQLCEREISHIIGLS